MVSDLHSESCTVCVNPTWNLNQAGYLQKPESQAHEFFIQDAVTIRI